MDVANSNLTTPHLRPYLAFFVQLLWIFEGYFVILSPFISFYFQDPSFFGAIVVAYGFSLGLLLLFLSVNIKRTFPFAAALIGWVMLVGPISGLATVLFNNSKISAFLFLFLVLIIQIRMTYLVLPTLSSPDYQPILRRTIVSGLYIFGALACLAYFSLPILMPQLLQIIAQERFAAAASK